jgi:hypothetical protein
VDNAQFWTLGRFRRNGLILFGCNTCEQVDEWGKPKQVITDKTLASLFSAVRVHRKDASGALTIGLIHHPLYSDDAKEVLQNRGLFVKNLSDHGEDVILLCGHVHSGGYEIQEIDGVRVLELIASTITKKEEHRPPDSLRSFWLLTFERKQNRVVGLAVDICRFERHRLVPSQSLVFKRTADGRFSQDKTRLGKRK